MPWKRCQHEVATFAEKQRCEVAIEVALNEKRLAAYDITTPEGVVGARVPDLPSGTFHIFIAKSSPRAESLLAQINQAIDVLNYRGMTDEIFLKYLPQCGRHC